jgi:thiol-disulfide isomerase/thioredoxin
MNLTYYYFLSFQGDPKDVIELTDSNFDSLVLNSEDMWLVEFYAPWCGHCKNLAPHWAQAASELKGKVRSNNITKFMKFVDKFLAFMASEGLLPCS